MNKFSFNNLSMKDINNIFTQGTVEVLCQPPDEQKGGWCYGYIL